MPAPTTMKIDDVEYVRKDSVEYATFEGEAYTIGKQYFVQTVTHAYHGTLVKLTDNDELILTNCAWIANTGYLSEFMKNVHGNNLEVEPFQKDQKVIVNRTAIIMSVEHSQKHFDTKK